MKRMKFIHVALFAVLTFMGSISLSAQQNWLPPAQAQSVIKVALQQLHAPAPTPVKGVGNYNPSTSSGPNGKTAGCPDCTLNAVKEAFLLQVLERSHQGMATGAAVDEVRAMMIAGANNTPSLLTAIQTAYVWVTDLLS